MAQNLFASIGLDQVVFANMLDHMSKKGMISSINASITGYENCLMFFDPGRSSRISKYSISENRSVFVYGTHYFSSGSGHINFELLWDDVNWSKIYDHVHGHYFLLAIDTTSTPSIVMVSDPLGLIHIYLREIDGKFFISSSSNLLASLKYCPDPDLQGCLEFGAAGTLFEDRTFFSEVSKIISRSRLKFMRQGDCYKIYRSRFDNYWQNARYSDLSSCEEASKLLIEQLKGTVLAIGRSFPRCLLDVTGGFDSRLVLAAFESSGIKFEGTVTSGYNSKDQSIAKKLSDEIGFKLRQINLGELLQGTNAGDLFDCLRNSDGELGIAETFGVFLLKKHLGEVCDVSLTGTGGELLRGRWWEGEGDHIGKRHDINVKQVVKRLFPYGCDWLPFDRQMKKLCEEEIANYVKGVSHTLECEINTRKIDSIYADHRLQHWAGRHISNTTKTMPCLSPLLMGKIPQLSYSIRPNVKRNSAVVRSALSVMHRRIALVSLDKGGPALPLDEFTMSHHVQMKMNEFKTYLNSVLNRVSPIKSKEHLGKFDSFFENDLLGEFLDYNKMVSSFIYDKKGLASFLKKWKRQGSIYQISRMFTLEWALRNARDCVVRGI